MSQDYETRTTPEVLAEIEKSLENLLAPPLDRISDALEKLAESITQNPPTVNQYVQNLGTPSVSLEDHPGESAVAVDEDVAMIILADGRRVPQKAVDAMAEFEQVWPGASFPNARAGLAWHVLAAAYPFVKKRSAADGLCLDEEPDGNAESPCIRDLNHEDNHQDNLGGFWEQL